MSFIKHISVEIVEGVPYGGHDEGANSKAEEFRKILKLQLNFETSVLFRHETSGVDDDIWMNWFHSKKNYRLQILTDWPEKMVYGTKYNDVPFT